MSRRHPVDVVAALILKLKKNIGQSLERHFVLSLLAESLADLIILAVDAPEVAKPKKNIARTISSHERRLFAEMRGVGRNYREQSRITGGDFVIETIHVAIARAYSATRKHLH
jgi:hypothetical protein